MNTDNIEPTDTWLTHQWIVAGIVAAAARFIPLPFMDDVVRDQCRRFVVARTLAAHPTTGTTLVDLTPFYADSGGCATGFLGMLAKAPLKLLLFPIRKIVVIVTSIRGVPLEMTRTILLGRTLQRQLASGPIDPQRAARMRLAFDEAFSLMDFRAIQAALSDAMRGVADWKGAAIKAARKLASSSRQQAATDIRTTAPVDQSADRVQNVLERPETVKLFAEFDARFDRAYRA
ncbi:hypothetical protein SH139x_004299 [Planctomycetaceae bacterium SH139]